jgi:hypothetical protein
MEDSSKLEDLHLRHDTGGYSVWCLGAAGEARPHRAVRVTLTHRFVKRNIITVLQTDVNGCVRLGALDNVTNITAVCFNSKRGEALHWTQGSWPVKAAQCQLQLRSYINASQDDIVKIPYTGSATSVSATHFGLFRVSRKTGRVVYIEDLTASAQHFLLARNSKESNLVLRALPAGEYCLTQKEPTIAHTTRITVLQGKRIGNSHVLGAHKFVELNNARNAACLQVLACDADPSQELVSIQLGDANPRSCRVHVFSSHFVNSWDAYSMLRQAPIGIASAETPVSSLPSLYTKKISVGDEYQYVLDRKHAKQQQKKNKRIGNMLTRPSLVITERKRKETAFDAEPVLSTGESFQRQSVERERMNDGLMAELSFDAHAPMMKMDEARRAFNDYDDSDSDDDSSDEESFADRRAPSRKK